MSGKKGMKTKKLLESFLPYYGRYKKILIFDLFCAALTTLGELILPLMLRYITNQGMQDLASMTAGIVIRIGGLYLILRIIDSLAAYYMAYTGHVMGVYIETDMRQDAFEHLQMLSDSYYSNTKVGQIMSRITSDLFDVTEFAHHCPEQFQRGITGIERFQEIMDVVPDIKDSKNAKKMEHVKGAISFDHVSFEYPDDHVPVLEDINITVRPGERIALVGPSGGGKTTMCNLLPRFYDTTSGSITIDGQDIKNVTLQSLRSNIGVVQQDVYLFSGSVYENISYGRPGATREEVMEAAKLAGAHEFITELQDGYDTYVGERGVKLSGGQKQRISIARVFLKNPAILILDEATSALDNESEYLVSQSLEKLAVGRTTLTIAHRLTTIQGADRILVLAGNKIVEEGNHEQLLEKKGMYYQLYTTANRLNQGIA